MMYAVRCVCTLQYSLCVFEKCSNARYPLKSTGKHLFKDSLCEKHLRQGDAMPHSRVDWWLHSHSRWFYAFRHESKGMVTADGVDMRHLSLIFSRELSWATPLKMFAKLWECYEKLDKCRQTLIQKIFFAKSNSPKVLRGQISVLSAKYCM